jgi:hypothetical protein
VAEPRQPQPPPVESTPAQRAAAIATVLGTGAAAGAALAGPPVLTAALLAALTKLLLRWSLDRRTVRHVLRVTTRVVRTTRPEAPTPAPGPAELANRRAELTFRAWFLERSLERVEAAYKAGAEDGAPEAREDRYIDQHLAAIDARHAAARKVDAEARKPDQVADRPIQNESARVILLWRAHPDDRVTPECRAADGAWFYADTPPIIGYPGMPHGGTCRCWPANAGSLEAVARGRHVNEAVRAIISTDTQHRPHPAARPERTAS